MFFFVLAPHQPRLDWQMWFAALGEYKNNPWFVNLLWRLLHNRKSGILYVATQRIDTVPNAISSFLSFVSP